MNVDHALLFAKHAKVSLTFAPHVLLPISKIIEKIILKLITLVLALMVTMRNLIYQDCHLLARSVTPLVKNVPVLYKINANHAILFKDEF